MEPAAMSDSPQPMKISRRWVGGQRRSFTGSWIPWFCTHTHTHACVHTCMHMMYALMTQNEGEQKSCYIKTDLFSQVRYFLAGFIVWTPHLLISCSVNDTTLLFCFCHRDETFFTLMCFLQIFNFIKCMHLWKRTLSFDSYFCCFELFLFWIVHHFEFGEWSGFVAKVEIFLVFFLKQKWVLVMVLVITNSQVWDWTDNVYMRAFWEEMKMKQAWASNVLILSGLLWIMKLSTLATG